MHRLLQAALTAALLACAPLAANAAESYDNCTGFIDSLPAVITTQGTWCLRKDLNTGMTAGEAIFVEANNVTVDCNHHKVGGLSAGVNSRTQGILSWNRQNITVRNCVVRGFYTGISLFGGGGHVVEGNRVDNALYTGISVSGDSGLVRGNQVNDTGGAPDKNYAYAITAVADIIDNAVDGVFATGVDTYPTGISASLAGGDVRDNRVRRLIPSGAGRATGIGATTQAITFSGNRVVSTGVIQGWGVVGGALAFCAGNTVSRFSTPFQSCQDAGGNASN